MPVFPSLETFPGSGVYPEGLTPLISLIEVVPVKNPLESLSGVILNQNQTPGLTDYLSVGDTVIQEFYLPSNYQRGSDDDELLIPQLSGIQILIGTDADEIDFTCTLQYKSFGLDWVTAATGSNATTGATTDRVWASIYFDTGVVVPNDLLTERWRIILSPNSGITKLWYSTPNPLIQFAGTQAYASNGTTPLTRPSDGSPYSFCFRLLGLTADEGIDPFGNQYRSVVTTKTANNINTASGADPNQYWLSKPNPSRFAVESIYFDIRPTTPITYTRLSSDPTDLSLNPGGIDDNESVVDRIIVDPLTPGVYFNIYYSSEGDPGTSEEEWEAKLWNHVPQTFRMAARETHVLPAPIRAKYIKVEFTHLQAKAYAPGIFQQPMFYKKHPKWVLDYFLARVEANRIYNNDFVSSSTSVSYNALDLAFNYYSDDIKATMLNADRGSVQAFLSDRSDASDQVDPTTLALINLTLEPYRKQPALRSRLNSLLGQYARSTVDSYADYAVEQPSASRPNLTDVSTLNRDRVVFEENYPVMFFYLTCRHKYREVMGSFEQNIGYFVGVREFAFSRETYISAYDASVYVESGADLLNAERNEFVS